MEEVTVYDYAEPVYKVLQEPDLLAGIGVVPAMVILIVTVLLGNLVSKWLFLVGIILYVAARIVCKKDSLMLTVVFQKLMHPNIWRAS